MGQPVLYEVEGRAAWLILNRPDVLNALSEEVFRLLLSYIDKAEADPNISAIVLTGAGDRAFSAGADIKEFKQRSLEEAREFVRLGQSVMLRLMRSPKVAIAAVNGVALGGGYELAMACDIRITSENARFGQPEPRLGIIPVLGGTYNLPRLVGYSRAAELLLTSRIIDAREAADLGLVSRVVPGGELRKTVMEVVEQISTLAP